MASIDGVDHCTVHCLCLYCCFEPGWTADRIQGRDEMAAVWRKLVRFAGKPLPDQVMTLKAKLRAAPRNIPYISEYFEDRCKARLFGGLAPLVPAVKDMFDGEPGLKVFKANGDEFLRVCRDIYGLRPDENVLDVGCGIGRKTLPLTQYLTRTASYEGIDVARAGIEWCRKRITPRFPNFRFQHIDVHNRHYNPNGKYSAAAYKFPFKDEHFDFVVLWSVFTHMMPDGIGNYLSEIRRVLKHGGRCLITYFFVNDESTRLISGSKSSLNFRYGAGEYRVLSSSIPERAIAIDERLITDFYRKAGLQPTNIYYGSWCGRQKSLSYQDHVLATKE